MRKPLIHPFTGLPALGVLPSGQIVWPVLGASDPPPAATPPAAPAEPAVTPASATPAAKEFEAITSQEEFDRRLSDRLHRERQKYADYDDVKAKAAKLDELEAANATELEKAQKRADELAERERAATGRAVRAEIRALADGFADREDAVLNLGDLAGFVDPKTGDVDAAGIKTALKDVLERKPHLARPEPATPPPAAPGAPAARPVEQLRPGAAPNAPQKAASLEAAVTAALAGRQS